MQTDFLDAHERHWQDAELLWRAQRLANADHLYGMAAECGLKWLMLQFGMPFDETRGMPTERADQRHVDGIWQRFDSYRHGRQNAVGYALPEDNPFKDWHVAQRYAAQRHFDASGVSAHRAGAELVQRLIRKAERDSLNEYL